MYSILDIIVLALLYPLFYRKWKEQGRGILLAKTLFYLYLVLVLFVTLMPILSAIPSIGQHAYRPMNLVPFIDVTYRRGPYLRQIVFNVLMTMPYGFLFPLTRKPVRGFFATLLSGFALCLGIELLQPLLHATRTSDITDLITNLAGCLLGFLIYRLFRPLTLRFFERIEGKGGAQAWL